MAVHTDSIWPEMVDEILEDVHHVRGDIMEGDGVITAACKTLLLRVKYIFVIPTILVYQA